MENPSPDISTKVLAANRRNVVEKLGHGKTLTLSEVKSFEDVLLMAQDALEVRRAALIRKWREGGRLNEEEREEIRDVLPLESTATVVGRTAYRKEQKEYAHIFQTSDRTIKRWVKTGKIAGDMPPLDAPADMVKWWVKHYKQRVPPCILEAARIAAQPVDGLADALAKSEAEHELVCDVGTGFEEMLGRVKRAEADAYKEYKRVLDNNDEAALPLARKTWSELGKQLRELERDAHDILSRSGALVEKVAVEKAIIEIHVPIVNGLRSMWRRVKAKMLSASDSQQDRVWQEEVDRLLARLNATKFTAYE